jgi:hypothetical protein
LKHRFEPENRGFERSQAEMSAYSPITEHPRLNRR